MMSEVDATEPTPATRKKSFLGIVILIACAIAGGGAGLFVAVPVLTGSPAEAGAAEATESASSKHHGKQEVLAIFSIDNLVVNPRDTNGTRFLVVSAAFEFGDPLSVEKLNAREAEVRDVLTRTFGDRSVEELADVSLRDMLRDDLASAVGALLPADSVRRVYLPQFVIQ